MDNYTGKRLDGRYEIQEVIGVGGMAVVYKAYDNIDDRIVAVKILKDEFLANEDFRRRFKNESKAISLLSHPNIVKVFNVNYGDRLQYIVMEYVEGITLKEYIEQQGRLGIKETIYFSTQILRALQHAHDKGIIHRDIKPQNILLLSNGTIKISDFGIARFSYSDTKTMTDSAIGSVHYISPEQARGGNIDERTDVYSAGVVMYEMLTGMLPFVSDNSVSVALMQLQNDAKSVREINPNIPVGLEQIVKRSMEKNTKARYQTASEMLLDIEEFKRNPNIKFRQDYFVDSEPTKYMDKPIVSNRQQEPMPTQPPQQPVYEDNEASKGKGGFVVIGMIIGLLVVALAGFGYAYFFTDVFRGNKVDVPNFEGLNYQTDILGNAEYKDFSFEIIEQPDDRRLDGTVIKQDPGKNALINPAEKKITLYIVDNSTPIQVPDVSDKTWESAQKELEDKGFEVKLVPQASVTIPFGTVIKTNPAAGQTADEGTLVLLYYASDEDMIEMPSVIDWDTDTAKEMLESLNLVLNTNFEQKPSDKPEGVIIEQDPAPGDKVMPGERVSVVLSSGTGEKAVNIKISLPSSNTNLSFEVYVNNERQINKTVLMDGSNYQFEVKGKDPNTKVKVHIDGDEYYTCTVDFSTETPVVRNGTYTRGDFGFKKVPDVKGKTYVDARSELKNAGFNNIIVEYRQVSDPSQDGIVLSQNFSSTGLLGYAITSTPIYLTVAQAEGIPSTTVTP